MLNHDQRSPTLSRTSNGMHRWRFGTQTKAYMSCADLCNLGGPWACMDQCFESDYQSKQHKEVETGDQATTTQEWAKMFAQATYVGTSFWQFARL